MARPFCLTATALNTPPPPTTTHHHPHTTPHHHTPHHHPPHPTTTTHPTTTPEQTFRQHLQPRIRKRGEQRTGRRSVNIGALMYAVLYDSFMCLTNLQNNVLMFAFCFFGLFYTVAIPVGARACMG